MDENFKLFSERVQNRTQRWWVDNVPVENKHVGGKLEGRAFAAGLGCLVPDQYSVVKEPAELPDFGSLPESLVIKPSRGWSAKNVFVMQSGINLLDGQQWSREAIVQKLEEDIRAGRGAPRYIVEELLVNWDGKSGIPLDYKFFMFGDLIALVHVIERNSGANLKENRHWYVTQDWELIAKRLVTTQEPEKELLLKPDCWDDMTSIVRKMARELGMFVRVDMYATKKGPVFGEFTPQPHGGKGFTRWADEWLGGLWKGVEGAG